MNPRQKSKVPGWTWKHSFTISCKKNPESPVFKDLQDFLRLAKNDFWVCMRMVGRSSVFSSCYLAVIEDETVRSSKLSQLQSWVSEDTGGMRTVLVQIWATAFQIEETWKWPFLYALWKCNLHSSMRKNKLGTFSESRTIETLVQRIQKCQEIGKKQKDRPVESTSNHTLLWK